MLHWHSDVLPKLLQRTANLCQLATNHHFYVGRKISNQVYWLSTSFTWNNTVTLLWTHPENIYICWYPHQRSSCNTSPRGQFVISQNNLICHSSNKYRKGVTSVGLKSVRCRLWPALLLPLFNYWASVNVITDHKLLQWASSPAQELALYTLTG